MKFSVFQVSRKGGREKNEDRTGYCYTRGSALFLLMDGLGGHPQGEVAAELAKRTISAMFQKEAKPELADIAAFLTSAVLAANRQILLYAIKNKLPNTPRTTVVAAVVQAGSASWIHLGDSRLYLVRGGVLLARTRDHSILEQHRDAPFNSKSPQSVNRNTLFSCLGSPRKPVFDIYGPVALQQGDRLMLCSDGLWASLDETDIVHLLGHQSVDAAVPDLVEKALQNAGDNSDNISCIALEWETPDGLASDTENISTNTISDGFFASTVQPGVPDCELEDMDDAAIERSIAEINETIRRTAAEKP